MRKKPAMPPPAMNRLTMTRNQPPNVLPKNGTFPALPTDSSPMARRKSPNRLTTSSNALATFIETPFTNPCPTLNLYPTARPLCFQDDFNPQRRPSLRVVEANLHAAQRPAVFVRQLKLRRSFARRRVLVLAQADLQAQRQLQLVARIAQTLDGLGHFGRALDRRVDGRAQLLHDLFGVVVDLQNLSRVRRMKLAGECSLTPDATRARPRRSNACSR